MNTKAEGYANVAVLQKSLKTVSQPADAETADEIEQRFTLLQLCRHLADLLQPFASVESTNERWRDEMLMVAEGARDKMAELHIDDPALETLKKGVEGLRTYEKRILMLEEQDRRFEEKQMDFSEMRTVLSQAIDVFADSANADTIDEWQLNKNAETVDRFCSSLMTKLVHNRYQDDECAQTKELLSRVGATVRAVKSPQHLPASCAHWMGCIAKNAQGWIDYIVKEVGREQQLQERIRAPAHTH